jgi:hypothetical protein
MTETFLILLAGGVMLAATISSPKQVTLQWLRLAGIIALALAALALFLFVRHEFSPQTTPAYRHRQLGLVIGLLVFILAQLAFVQLARPSAGRVLAALAWLLSILSGAGLIHDLMLAANTAVSFPPKPVSIALQSLTCAGIAAVTGLALMDMLLGHAYLTASRMTIHPFARLNNALAIALALRAVSAVALAPLLQHFRPREMLWEIHGLFIATRYLVGLVIPAVFLYMARDCIKRRSTQSATGILYVTVVLLFIGEMISLYLLRETGLPF